MDSDPSGWCKWETPFYRVRKLANLEVAARSMETLVVRVQDLESTEEFQIAFNSVLGFRFEEGANTQTLMNSFIVQQSSWISKMVQKPFLTRDISNAVHYIISTMEGQLHVVCLDKPRIETHPSITANER